MVEDDRLVRTAYRTSPATRHTKDRRVFTSKCSPAVRLSFDDRRRISERLCADICRTEEDQHRGGQYEETRRVTPGNCEELVAERIAKLRAQVKLDRRDEEYVTEIKTELPKLEYWKITLGDKINMIGKVAERERRRLSAAGSKV